MFTLGYLSLVQMFESVLGEEINSCFSYLTFINIQVLQRPILARAINYSRLGVACYSSPIQDFCAVVINGNMPQGQPPKRMLLLSSPWLWLPSSCKILSNRRNMTSHASSTDVPTTSPPSLLLFQIPSSTLPMQASRGSSGVQLTLNYAAQEFLLINHMVKKIIIITEAYIIQMTGHGFNVLFPF